MTKKNKKKLAAIIISIGFSFAKIAFALEQKYPAIPGLPSINTNNPTTGAFVGYFFGLLVYVAGILALISFVIGAVGLINPNIEAHKDAKDRMKGAILGLVLTFASVIILRTINPIFITPALTPLPGIAGVFYYNGSNQKATPQEEPNFPAWLGGEGNAGYNTIQYCCSAPNAQNQCPEGTGPKLLIWEFPKPNFMGNDLNYSGVKVVAKNCGETEPINNYGSFKIAYEAPGVYYCLGDCGSNSMCSGMMSEVIVGQNKISDTFAGQIGGIRIVNIAGLNFGAIFHQETDFKSGGGCSLPITNNEDISQCVAIRDPLNTYAADIFIINKQLGTAGDGITFYSEPWGEFTGQEAGFFEVPFNKITIPFSKFKTNPNCAEPSPNDICFDYTGVDVDYLYPSYCENFNDCPGSIKKDGKYLIGLYSQASADAGDAQYCQTFTEDVDNLGLTSYTPTGASPNSLHDIYVIPIH